ncbi:hypothetical protein BST13_35260 [Mycobacterium aquaticum]|uniref:Uncharacterized protein n=1 Tax=Mycobacterium aquaticum TaxID=1927124 RepID=A0A1X0A0B5_9MYCO|nr:hypothetical protein BST13_35260 [Mycobacterium aquaticum]
MMSDKPIDLGSALGAFGELIEPCEAVPLGEVWAGPRNSDPLRMFGPGTTDGGRAEAGWFKVGTLDGDGPTLIPDGPCECACDDCVKGRHCDRASCAQPA